MTFVQTYPNQELCLHFWVGVAKTVSSAVLTMNHSEQPRRLDYIEIDPFF
jgi:hypothetical protein